MPEAVRSWFCFNRCRACPTARVSLFALLMSYLEKRFAKADRNQSLAEGTQTRARSLRWRLVVKW